MINKLKAFFTLFQAYKRVNNPVAWKRGQIGVDAVSGFLMASVGAYIAITGTDITIANQTVDSMSAALIAFIPAVASMWDGVSTVITTNKLGVKPKVQIEHKTPE